MTKSKRIVLILSLLGVLATLLSWYLAAKPKPGVQAIGRDPVVQPPSSGVDGAGALTSESNTGRAAVPVAKSDVVASSSLSDGLNSAPNYRSYIFDALQRPKEGGRFYASLAFLKCQRFDYVNLQGIHPKSSRQEEAIKAVLTEKSRCDGVLQQFVDSNQFSRLALDSAGGPDVLMSKGGAALYNVNTYKSAAETLQAAKSSGDPNLLAFVLQSQVAQLLEERVLIREDNELDTSLWLKGAAAVGCSLNPQCKQSALTAISCATSGECDEDFITGLRESIPVEQRAAYDRIVLKIQTLAKSR